ncbi:MAG: hypothetical protein GY870_03285 [archaeon]|nr:hypothetical protein [archaeon]
MKELIIKNPPLMIFPKLCVRCLSKKVSSFQIGSQYRTRAFIHKITLNIPVCEKCQKKDIEATKKRNYFFLLISVLIFLCYWLMVGIEIEIQNKVFLVSMILTVPTAFYLILEGIPRKYDYISSVVKVLPHSSDPYVMPRLDLKFVNDYYADILAEINDSIVINPENRPLSKNKLWEKIESIESDSLVYEEFGSGTINIEEIRDDEIFESNLSLEIEINKDDDKKESKEEKEKEKALIA